MKFSYPKTFLLGFGFFGVSIIWGTYNAFVPLFLQDNFDLSAGWIGFFMTLDNIAALFIQPPVGAWSDRLRTKWGRRLPFIMVGAPIAAVAFGLIPIAAGTGVLAFFVACTSSLLLSMAFWRTPVIALMPDITPSEHRSQANGVINFMGGIGGIISFLLGGQLYNMNKGFPFWLGSALVIISSILVLIFIREPKVYEASEEKPDLLKSLKEVISDQDKSALRILCAIFFWFVAYNAIEAFFTLYAVNHLGMPGGDGAKLLGQLSLLFVIFALPAGYIGARIGRRKTILTGITLMTILMFSMYVIPTQVLTITLTKLPVVGVVPVVGLILMLAGASWALININSLPMVVDMTDASRTGTYTGLYYLFSTLAAIIGPNVNGWIIVATGNQYGSIMLFGPLFMIMAAVMMWGVKKGEAKKAAPVSIPAAVSQRSTVTYLGKKSQGPYVYTNYSAKTAADARAFLAEQKVTEANTYVVVETPEGNWGIDKEGLYLEQLLPWQTNLTLAQKEGSLAGLPATFGLSMAARGVNDNFTAGVVCGECGHTWQDGLRYKAVTVVRCPKCETYNRVDTDNLTVV